MNAKRLAYLRSISKTYAATPDDEFVATGEDVLELLDERDVLLKALKPIVERLDGDREFVIPDGGAEMLVAARAAIAKAGVE